MFGLHTHFGAPRDHETLNQVYDLGYGVLRIDAQNASPELAAEMAYDVIGAGMLPYVTVREVAQTALLPPNTKVELFNEPDLNGPLPAEYVALAQLFADTARPDLELYGPTISNLNLRGFAYLRAVWPLPERFKVSIHRYGNNTFAVPHKGTSSREDEVQQLQDIIGYRPFCVSECGFHMAPERSWRTFLRTVRMGEQQHADCLRREMEFWVRMGAEFSIIFQIDDGPTDIREHRYGIRTWDTALNQPGRWKIGAQR
jgi:hypothetical protein